jgi:hypothetical protein
MGRCFIECVLISHPVEEHYVGSKPLSSGIFFTAVTMKDVVFWDMIPWGSSKKNRRFGGIYRFHLQGNKALSLLSSQ